MRIDELEQRLADVASQQPSGSADPVGAIRRRVTRHRRRRAATAIVVVAVAVVGSAALITRGGNGSQRVVTEPPDTSTVVSSPTPSQSAAPSTTDTTATTVDRVAPTTDTTDTTAAITTDTTTGGPGCRNSTDPQCGPFFYDWPVDNRPAAISIVASPARPAIGEKVTFTVTIDDPDGRPISRCYSFDPDAMHVEPSGQANTTVICADGVAPGYGPWDPPPPWHAVETYDITYQVAGDHVVRYQTEEAGRTSSDSVPRASAELTVNVGSV